MNIAYIRKTDKSVKEVAERLKEAFMKEKIEVVAERELSGQKGVLLYFLKPEWFEAIAEGDQNLLGLVPSVALIRSKEDKTVIGIGNPQILAGGPNVDEIALTVEAMDRALREAVQFASGAPEPKVEKVTLYSTKTCPYCRMEKDYLEKHKVAFDLVMVDEDRAAAEAMIRKSGQTGVPQTEVRFDDGESEIIMGFDRDRLNELLAIAA